MHKPMVLWTTVLLVLSVTFLAATASAKSVLDILREKVSSVRKNISKR